MEKMNRRDRAKQFLPFNSLRGYYDLIALKEKEVIPKRDLSETDIEDLSNKLKMIEKNMMIKLKYYDIDRYVDIEGIVTKIDYENNYLVIVKTKISFSDVSNIYL